MSKVKAENIEDEINSFKRKIEKLETVNNALRTENQGLAQRAREADNRYGANTAETQMLKSEIENLRDMLKKADEERDKLRKKVTEVSKLTRSDNEDKDRQIMKLKDKVAAMDRVVQKSGHEIKDLSGKIPILVQEKKDLREDIERVKKEKASCERDTSVLTDQLQVVELKLKLKSEEFDALKIENEDLQSMNNGDDRIQTIDALEKLNHKLKLEIQAQRQGATSAERRLKEMEEQVSVLRDDLEDQVEELEKAMLDVVKYKEENTKLDNENNILMGENEELRDQIRSMVDDKVELAIIRDQKERILEDNLEQRTKIAALTERLGTMEATAQSLSLMTKEKQKHNNGFVNEIRELNDKIHNMEKNMRDDRLEKKKSVKFEHLEIELPLKNDKMGEKELKASVKRLQDENRRLRATLTMKNMSEQNGITQLTVLQEEVRDKDAELTKVRGREKRLEEWMNEIFNNKKYQLILQDEYKKAEDNIAPVSSRDQEGALPGIPRNPSMVSPRHTPQDDDDSQAMLLDSGRQVSNAFNSLGRSTTMKNNSQKPPNTGYSTNRGRLTGAYSRSK